MADLGQEAGPFLQAHVLRIYLQDRIGLALAVSNRHAKTRTSFPDLK